MTITIEADTDEWDSFSIRWNGEFFDDAVSIEQAVTKARALAAEHGVSEITIFTADPY